MQEDSNIGAAFVFGSRIRGNIHLESDLDLGLAFKNPYKIKSAKELVAN